MPKPRRRKAPPKAGNDLERLEAWFRDRKPVEEGELARFVLARTQGEVLTTQDLQGPELLFAFVFQPIGLALLQWGEPFAARLAAHLGPQGVLYAYQADRSERFVLGYPVFLRGVRLLTSPEVERVFPLLLAEQKRREAQGTQS